ncbi:unnamed protein product [Chondrus crispus]|uniref:Uncharacterized protein n=1 Tax=Chondrus crispus TaxID=2769 RepID=R7QE32_CHOCR|nr:unnamed protein product [Chondrus crispus]CDF36344.1 unnamed protein product [Chondrus crispus]|eukprot:XP_005716163.1 unnamed protein product [Chondrus crispus]
MMVCVLVCFWFVRPNSTPELGWEIDVGLPEGWCISRRSWLSICSDSP